MVLVVNPLELVHEKFMGVVDLDLYKNRHHNKSSKRNNHNLMLTNKEQPQPSNNINNRKKQGLERHEKQRKELAKKLPPEFMRKAAQ